LRVLKSCSTQSSHHMGWGLLTLLVASILQGFVSFVLDRCPSHLSLSASNTLIMSGSSYSWFNSLLYIICHLPFSLMGPYIFVGIFLSNSTVSLVSSHLVRAQRLLSYMRTRVRSFLRSLHLVRC
jgi:hypothetical protein